MGSWGFISDFHGLWVISCSVQKHSCDPQYAWGGGWPPSAPIPTMSTMGGTTSPPHTWGHLIFIHAHSQQYFRPVLLLFVSLKCYVYVSGVFSAYLTYDF